MARLTLLSLFAVSLLAACGSDGPGPSAQPEASLAPDTGAPAPAEGGPSPDAAVDAELRELATWMSGRYSSASQAKKDADYFAISLVMRRIWRAAGDGGYWLYVEQAVEGQAPYRQRVYRIERTSASQLVSKDYELRPSDAQKAVGAWKDKEPLSWLAPSAIAAKEGCEVRLAKHASGTAYTGETEEKKCLTSYQGASYTTSRVELTSTQLSSWDRGWDASGVQVWGAVKGPYIFDKLEPIALE